MIKILAISTSFLCLLGISFFANSQEFKKLTGSYELTYKEVIYQEQGIKKDRVIFSIQGDAAKEIFQNLSAAAKKSQCSDDVMEKRVGNLICVYGPSKTYQCGFGILFSTGEVVKGMVC